MTKTDNPFYHNYVFTPADLKRDKIKQWHYPSLYFRPTYTQISDGLVVYYKTTADGRIYILKTEEMRKQQQS